MGLYLIKSPWRIIWEQLTVIMLVILIVAAVVSAALGDYEDTVDRSEVKDSLQAMV
jgi:hypothetical protein